MKTTCYTFLFQDEKQNKMWPHYFFYYMVISAIKYSNAELQKGSLNCEEKIKQDDAHLFHSLFSLLY